MLKILLARLAQGHRTSKFPDVEPALAERFRGRPALEPAKCSAGCRACADACPTGAIAIDPNLALDTGRCLFCTDCVDACPDGAIAFTPDYRLASRDRGDLVVTGAAATVRALELGDELRKLFGRSLKLRVVSAGGCNGCESDVAVLGTVVFDLGRFGIQFVASPRHADGLLITGPVTENMRLALHKTYEAVPDPKIVIAVGACAISGGPYIGHPEQHGGADTIVPVDLYVPGCPPHPYTILEGLLGLIGRRSKRATVELGAEPAWIASAADASGRVGQASSAAEAAIDDRSGPRPIRRDEAAADAGPRPSGELAGRPAADLDDGWGTGKDGES